MAVDNELSSEIDITLGMVPMYKVYLLNDDFTPIEFVVALLMEVFNRDLDSAYDLTMKIHHEGRGLAGIYAREIAATKQKHATESALAQGYPLQVLVEQV